MTGPKILVLDIETAPLIGFAWKIWDTNIDAMSQVIEHPRMLCFGARWHGERDIFFASEYHQGRRPMLEQLHELMDEADFIAGWNSARFDRPWVNGEFDKEGLGPAAPSKDIDLMKVAKKNLKLISYKLDYVAQHHYGLRGKVTHQGFRLWRDIVIGTPAEQERAWRKMMAYQRGDIRVTDAVLDRMKGWVTALPNPALYGDGDEPEACGCGNERLVARGYAYTATSQYKRYQCTGPSGCGAWLRGARREKGIDLRRIG